MIEFSIAGSNYRAGKLSAFAQLHVSRKIAPVLPKILPAMIASMSLVAPKQEAGAENSEKPKLDLLGLANALGPVAQALADMPDADAEFVYGTCLGVVQIQQGTNWSAIWNEGSKTAMFDQIDLGVMTQLVGKVIWDSLGNFIAGFLAKIPQA